jgi:hypothetical protein
MLTTRAMLAMGLLLAMPAWGKDAAPAAGRWAAPGDQVAAALIEQERRWGTESCVPNDVVKTFIADDFIGTSPAGALYDKASLLARQTATPTARDCRLLSARVRYFGADTAVIYGSETAMVTGPDGKAMAHTLIWTDTLLRRGGRWQVIAVQDMVAPPGWQPPAP